MSGFNKNSDNQEFIKKLELLRDLEAEKPVEEMDVSLVMACVELILELRGETVNFTPEEVEEKVRKIPFVEETTTLNTPPKSVKGRSTKVKSRKILLIAAIISILIAIFTVTSIAFEWNIFDELKNRFGTVANTPVNQEFEIDGISVFMSGENKTYKNLDEFFRTEDLKVLYPTKLPDELLLNSISFYDVNGNQKLDYIFSDSRFLCSITINKKIDDNIKLVATEIITINNFDCYVIEISDIGVTQIYFEYNNNLYKFNYNNKQDLIDAIEILKVFKNEN